MPKVPSYVILAAKLLLFYTVPTVAITGGIATGKTTFRNCLVSRWKPVEVFDADAYVTELIDGSKEVRHEIQDAFGQWIYQGGKLDRERMRTLVFSSVAHRSKLESILHPRIQAVWRARAFQSAGRKILVEIPLLYETGGATFCDFVVVVACSFSTQLKRLTDSRGLEEALSRNIIQTQISIAEKIRCANEVIWNDGPEYLLQEQAVLTANYLTERYG